MEDTNKLCEGCRHWNEVAAKFCRVCGDPVESPVRFDVTVDELAYFNPYPEMQVEVQTACTEEDSRAEGELATDAPPLLKWIFIIGSSAAACALGIIVGGLIITMIGDGYARNTLCNQEEYWQSATEEHMVFDLYR